MPKGHPGPVYTNEHQALHQRLRWLRQNQKPYMTQEQLATASGVSISFIKSYEVGGVVHMSTETLRKLAHGLGCKLTIRMTRLSNREIIDCLPEGPPLPPVPKRKSKISAEARTRALSRERSPWSVARQQRLERSRKSSGETAN